MISKFFREIFNEYPIRSGWSVRFWLISNEDDRVVVQVTLSDAEDHIAACCFATGLTVSDAQGHAIANLHSMVIGDDDE